MRKKDEMLYMELALRVKMRQEFDADFGHVHFSLSYREKTNSYEFSNGKRCFIGVHG